MPSDLPDPRWKYLGSTSNADFYEMEPTLLAVVPHEDSRDDATTARESIAFQDRHWKGVGRRGAIIVFMDRVLEQDAGAREVYANEPLDTLTTHYALVSESMFAQATAAVFTGLSKPPIPTQVFRTLEDARAWIAESSHGPQPVE